MIGRKNTTVVQIPIDDIRVLNPRSRSKWKFRQIVANIGKIGLKRPITVVQRDARGGEPRFDLVCGQGRLEACRSLGDTTVPGLVVEASSEDVLLMGLAENLARRRYNGLELLREIGNMRGRGHRLSEIARRTDLPLSFVKGVCHLLKRGEDTLVRAVERGQIPVSIAVTIATADDEAVQRALAEAYESHSLRGKDLMRARRIIEKRRAVKVVGSPGVGTKDLSGGVVMEALRRETAKQRALVQKAKVCETRLLFVVSALTQLFADPAFVAIIRAAGLAKLPRYLADRVGTRGG